MEGSDGRCDGQFCPMTIRRRRRRLTSRLLLAGWTTSTAVAAASAALAPSAAVALNVTSLGTAAEWTASESAEVAASSSSSTVATQSAEMSASASAQNETAAASASLALNETLHKVDRATAAASANTTEEGESDEDNSFEEVHPWLLCDPSSSDLCMPGYYCSHDAQFANISRCEPFPTSSSALASAQMGQCDDLTGKRDFRNCPPSGEECTSLNLPELGLEDCLNVCNRGVTGEGCSDDDYCTYGSHFCDFENGETGACRPCKDDPLECLTDPELTEERGREDCLLCDLLCWDFHFEDATFLGESSGGGASSGDANITSSVSISSSSNASAGTDISNRTVALSGSPSLSAAGPLVDCSDLILDSVHTCPDANGSICLVEDYTQNTLYFDVVWKCEASGGVAVVFFATYNPNSPYLSLKETSIPSVFVLYEDGVRLKDEELGSVVNVTVTTEGSWCMKEQTCTTSIPCIGQWADDAYCSYNWDGEAGICRSCPTDADTGDPDPYGCFFDRRGGTPLNPNAVQSCSENCAADLTYANCKLCPKDLTVLEFGVGSKEEKCKFCPNDDVQYSEREVSLFVEGTKCWQLQAFFDLMDVHVDSENCRLAQMQNYVCGCEGPGYGGASTDTKRAVLAWLPRAMAILSIMGSSFIVFDALRSVNRRRKVFYQLMVGLSIFDIVGSTAYAFTTLPIPATDYIYGSHGNDATCTAQGFFIQLGTTSCYINVSLSIYYLLIIKMGWSERQIAKVRLWLFLCPILIGLAFALAGLTFYGNTILWCNNTASYWPEVPVAVAILVATVTMGAVCWDVYRKEKASAKWRGGATATGASGRGDALRSNRLSRKVFWQSIWYLTAFYLTWPPYLALQFSWVSGHAFSNYGIILFAGTAVPLQGFWNFVSYVRPRYLKGGVSLVSVGGAIGTSLGSMRATFRRKSTIRQKKKATAVSSPPMTSRTSHKEAKVEDGKSLPNTESSPSCMSKSMHLP